MSGRDGHEDEPVSGRGDRRIAAILSITEVLCGKTEYTEVVASALEASLETVGADSGSILLHSPTDNTLVFEYVVGPIADRLLGRSMPVTEGVAGKVFRTGEPSLLNDVSQAPEHYHRIADETGYPSVTMITVPLRTAGGRTLGALQAINKRHGPFEQEDLELLTIVATQAATIIENARLHEAARLGAAARLLAKVGHDVKNMIAPVVASARALEKVLQKHFEALDGAAQQGLPTDPEFATRVARDRGRCREATDLLVQAALRVGERTQQMADCIRGEMPPPVMAPTRVSSVAREVAGVLGPVAAERGVELVLQAGDDPEVMADSSQIFNAVYNLVVNAIPATPSGGRVRLGIEAVPEGAFPEGRCVRVEVSDNGSGIPAPILRRLFSADAITTKSGGTGLGTRIVKEVADIHGGTVSAVSEEGKGSCFTLTLPLAEVAAAE
jgi:signal transduction histidine kinase